MGFRSFATRAICCALAFQLAVTGCATVRAGAADVLIPVEDENQLGEQLQAEVLKQEEVLDDEVVQAYVDDVGQRLLKASGEQIPQGLQPSFTVLAGDTVNAFTIPGGHIYVYAGLLRSVENEAELAGVLAHELGHVAERHVAKQLVTQLGVQTVGQLVLGRDPSTLAQLGATIAANGYLLRYSRDSEREADDVGMDLMIASGFDPRGLIEFFETLRDMQGRDPSDVEVFFSSHPPPGDRAERLTERLNEAGNPRGDVDSNPIAPIQERLPEPAAEPEREPSGSLGPHRASGSGDTSVPVDRSTRAVGSIGL